MVCGVINIRGSNITTTQEIMKAIGSPNYHHNRFVATHVLVSKSMSCNQAIVVITGRAHCVHDFVYMLIKLQLRDSLKENLAGLVLSKATEPRETHQLCEESILLYFVMGILEELKVAGNIWKEVNVSLNDHRQLGI